MNVVDIKDIATLFGSRAKLGDIEAEAFVNSMFSVIKQGLEADRLMKIRGFGTFKIIDVEARESVSVNTGERVVIESHRKVTFTPDATMKELVNKPFSLFNTVALNDGVEFDDTETETPVEADAQEVETVMQDAEAEVQGQETETQKPENDEEQTDETPQAEMETTVETSGETTVAYEEVQGETDEEAQSVVEDKVPDNITDVQDGTDNTPEETESVPEETENIPEEATGISDDTTDAPYDADNAKDDTTEEPTVVPKPVEDEDKTDETSTSRRNHKALTITLYCLLTLVLMAASAYAGMLYGRHHTGDDCAFLCGTSAEKTPTAAVAANEETPQPKPQADNVKPAKPDTLVKDTSKVQEKAVAKEKPQADGDNKPADKNQKNKDDEVAAMMQTATRYADKDIRVRTGAYCIVGTARTVTVSQGESLASISRRELGPGMDCYMETFNDLSSDAALKAGQTVRIPKLILRKTLRKMAK